MIAELQRQLGNRTRICGSRGQPLDRERHHDNEQFRFFGVIKSCCSFKCFGRSVRLHFCRCRRKMFVSAEIKSAQTKKSRSIWSKFEPGGNRSQGGREMMMRLLFIWLSLKWYRLNFAAVVKVFFGCWLEIWFSVRFTPHLLSHPQLSKVPLAHSFSLFLSNSNSRSLFLISILSHYLPSFLSLSLCLS